MTTREIEAIEELVAAGVVTSLPPDHIAAIRKRRYDHLCRAFSNGMAVGMLIISLLVVSAWAAMGKGY